MPRKLWLRAAFIAAFLAAVTYLFVESTALDPAQQVRTLQAINALNRADAELDRNLFLTRSGMRLHYDSLNRAVAELYRQLEALSFGSDTTARTFPDEMIRQFEVIRANVAHKEELVEQFKSSNALLRNSWAYFTVRSHEVSRRNATSPGSEEFTATIGQLPSVMLRVLRSPHGEAKDNANALLDHLEKMAVPKHLTLAVNSMLLHGRLILNLSPGLDSTLKNLLALPTTTLINLLRNSYIKHQHRIEERAKRHRVLLYVVSVLLLAYLIYLFYRLQASARDLFRVNEGLVEQIAERRRAEGEAHELQTELAHVHRLSTMGEMATGLAHELNQPLAAITSYAQGCVQRMRLRKTKPDEMIDIMNKISLEAKRAASIIHRLRSLARKRAPRQVRINVNAAIREIAGLLEAEAHRHHVRIALDLSNPLPKVMADTIEIQQIVLNLMRNGMEAMEEDVSAPRDLTIRTERKENNFIKVAVQDSGHGIPPEILERIFDPFYTTKLSGLGLGLSICRSIVEGHGGRLWATSDADTRTTFFFTLPIAEEDPHDNV
ncbi:MAG: hypothetical protein HQ483_00740 [Rhodospirillales bacterium]|nr:hypothetical protein [Rhodospirillales bacterium]